MTDLPARGTLVSTTSIVTVDWFSATNTHEQSEEADDDAE
jgi:hypothetical protein